MLAPTRWSDSSRQTGKKVWRRRPTKAPWQESRHCLFECTNFFEKEKRKASLGTQKGGRQKKDCIKKKEATTPSPVRSLAKEKRREEDEKTDDTPERPRGRSRNVANPQRKKGQKARALMSRRDSRCARRNAEASPLSRLPDDILARILVDGLDDQHRRVAALTCRRWRAVIATGVGAGANLCVDACIQGLLAADGCLDVLVWLAERVPRGDAHWHPIARGAAARGHLHVLDWAASEVSRAYLDEALPYAAAAGAGRIDVLMALDQRGYRDLSGAAACTAAVAGGHLDCAAWLLARGATLDYRAACEHAVAACDIDALAWLCDLARDYPERGYDWDPVALMGLASRVGVSAWLLECARRRRHGRAP